MKPLRSAIAVLGLTAWATGVANGNVLFNATLDQTGITTQNNPCPIGWVVDAELSTSGGFFDGGDSETFCNVCDPGGYGFFFKPFQGSVGPPADLLTVQLYQDNPCTPGTMCTLSGYAVVRSQLLRAFYHQQPGAPDPVLRRVPRFLE